MGEVTSLVRDARKAGVQLDAISYNILIQSRVLEKDTDRALNLFKEMKEAKLPRGGFEDSVQLLEHPRDGKEGGPMLAPRHGEECGLMSKLLQEIKDGQMMDSGVNEWNNVIHFFCKKRLKQDAEKALKKKRNLCHVPNARTFHSLVTGYAAMVGKYTEVAELWGQMKSIALSSGMEFGLELLDPNSHPFYVC